MGNLPLEGVRVVDQTLVWVGPFCAQLLADWGAEVIRVEPLQVFQPMTRAPGVRPIKRGITNYTNDYPDGDPGDRHWNRNVLFQLHGRNKLSMTSDLPNPDCLETFLRLVSISDVVIENNVPQTYDKLGVTYRILKEVRPDIILARAPAFGLSGPYANYRAFGTHMESVAGHTWIRGYRDAPPHTKGSTFLSDAIGGVTTAFAIVAALCHRRDTGEGQLIEVPTAEATVSYIGEAIMDYAMNRRVQAPLGNGHPSRAPQGCYPCKGRDNWLVISIGTDEEWEGLRRAMGDPEWTRDSALATVLGRYRRQEEIDGHLTEWTRDRDHIQIMHLLQANGVPAAPVNDQGELFADPQMRSRGYFEELTQPATGTHLYPGMMWKMAETPNRIRFPSPMLGEHNEWAYKELLGTTEEEYGRLEDAGHIGMDYPDHLG